jgi:hypothetical protein
MRSFSMREKVADRPDEGKMFDIIQHFSLTLTLSLMERELKTKSK